MTPRPLGAELVGLTLIVLAQNPPWTFNATVIAAPVAEKTAAASGLLKRRRKR